MAESRIKPSLKWSIAHTVSKTCFLYEAYYIKHGKAEKIKIVAPKQKREEVEYSV